jgi:nucleoside-diphosphate-sugar epimerase
VKGLTVLVTGATGGIGRQVVSELIAAQCDVVGLDRIAPDTALAESVKRFVVGDVADEAVVASACQEVEAVAHLAAIPSPVGNEQQVFRNNAACTYSVLEAAASSGVKAVVLASSISALGLAYAPERFSPVYVPIDEEHPLRPCDPYALSKECDEKMAAMFARRFDTTVLAYRFPFTSTAENIAARAELMTTNLEEGERELWSYLDVRDAAMAVVLGLSAAVNAEVSGYEVLNIIADDSMIDGPLVDAVRAFHPGTEIRARLGARDCAYSVSKAQRLIGFSATYLR